MRYQAPRRSGPISPILVIVIVNLLIFIATYINQQVIYARFALLPATLGQEPWTVFTYMFVHGGLSHIIFNMITLYFFGRFVIALVGEGSFLITYFLGGIVGGLFFYLYTMLIGYPFTYLVGASGAIYALGGLLLVMRPKAKVVVFPIPVPISLWIAILVGFALSALNVTVAWQAHLGGLVLGAVIGLYFRRRENRPYWNNPR
jgi:membrane associated rhomboid family serine protease